MSSPLKGARRLLPVAMREDARNIAPWVVLISVLSATSILAYAWVFTTTADRMQLSATVAANPAMSLIFGQARDLMTADGFNAWRAGQLGAFFAGLMTILIVVRNSRAQEDSGQAELLASSVLTRPARLAVAVLMAVIASVALGVLSWVLTVLCGGGAVNSLVLSSTFVASGILFAGVAAVTAQIGGDSRAATTLAIAVLGVLFIARGYFDASQAADWTAWVTPFGWLGRVAPATDNNPWPLVLTVVVGLLLVACGFALQSRRDFGMGLIPPRRGPARGGWESTKWGLVLRVNLGPILTWLLGFVVLGMVFGFLANAVGDVLASNPLIASALAAGATDKDTLVGQFLLTIFSIAGLVAAIAGVQVVMRMYAEETADRADPVLAGAVSRSGYLVPNLVVAFVTPALALLIGGAMIAIVASSHTGIAASRIVGQALITTAATWVLIALSLAAVGAKPRVRLVGWLAIVAAFALTILGPLFRLWNWILGISPFWHLPNVSAATPDWTGLLWLSLVLALLVVVAFVGYRRRDIV